MANNLHYGRKGHGKNQKPEWQQKIDAGLIHPNDMNDCEMAYRLKKYLMNVHGAQANSMYVQWLDKIIEKGVLT